MNAATMPKNMTLAGIQEELSLPLDIALTIVKGGFSDDWWLIERAEHPNMKGWEDFEWGKAFRYTGRISDADVEGQGWSMRHIAGAIESYEPFEDTRCAVSPIVRNGEQYWEVRSPRNSRFHALIPHHRMMALANEIREKVKP